jgi:2-oxoisovalerate dehydrogenase E1 component
MYLSRRMDDKEIQLKRQNRIFFQISGAGHEAVLTAAGMLIRAGYDWFYSVLSRSRLLPPAGGDAGRDALRGRGRRGDPASGGRQMPSHWGHKKFNIVIVSSPTGTQFLQAVGIAEASKRAKLLGITEGFTEDEVVYVSTGDGTTSEGEFWESLNSACNLKLPVVYVVEDNGYAISVPVEVNTPGGNDLEAASRRFPDSTSRKSTAATSWPHMRSDVSRDRLRAQAEGTGARARACDSSLLALALGRRGDVSPDVGARGRCGARSARELSPKWLIAEGHATEESLDRSSGGGRREVLAPRTTRSSQPQPTSSTIYTTCLLPDVDPTGSSSTPRTIRSSPASRRRWSICSTRA